MIGKTYFLRLVNDFLLPRTVPTEHFLEADHVKVAQIVFNELRKPFVLVIGPTIRDTQGPQEQVESQKAKLVGTCHHLLVQKSDLVIQC